MAHRFVRIDAAALGLGADFGLLDAGDAADVIDLVRQEHGHAETGRRFPRKQTLADIYSRTVNAQRPLREVLDEAFPWCAEHGDDLAGLFRAYTARKRALGVLDLDDLLLFWRALARDPQAGARLAERFDHVLVDEYQDVNELQVEVVAALARHGATVTAVGDDFQAIYSFRSASAQHILGFAQRFAGAATIVLERNYRSPQPLLDLANAVGAAAEEGLPKTLRADRDGGERPQLVFCRDQAQEATEICDRVLAARERGMLLREQAVLARTGHDTDLLELELSRRRIPFVKYGGLRYLEAAHVKDFLALLRLTDRMTDEMSWFRLLMLLDGVGPARARRTLDRLLAGGLLSAAQLSGRWTAAREELPAAARDHGDALAAALEASPDPERLRDALAPIVRAHYPDGAVRVQDLDALCGLAKTAGDLRTFVAELLLDPPASSADLAGRPHQDDDWLVISTVHSAKGLEWQAVHVVAAYDGNFPSDLAAGTRESLAEERRLLYVAITRARRSLTVYVPRRFYFRADRRDGHGYGKVSRFLDADARACCEVVHLADDLAIAAAPGAAGPRRITVSTDELFA
jgi:DNA helicase-2/ATP-dependent DNA helicase PcrA